MTSLWNGLKIAASNKQKAVIEFLHCEGETQSNIAKRLKAVYKDHVSDRATVCVGQSIYKYEYTTMVWYGMVYLLKPL